MRTILDLRTGFLESARERAEWAHDRVPFAREKRMFAATLASLALRTGHADRAAAVSAECADDITSLVRFHALASNGQRADARALYAVLKQQYVPEPYTEMREEIASRYGVIDQSGDRDEEWIYEEETKLLVLEAA